MASNLTVMGNKEILLVAETIAHEKSISPVEIFHAKELSQQQRRNMALI